MDTMVHYWAINSYVVVVWSYKPGVEIPADGPMFSVWESDIHFVCYLDRRDLHRNETPFCEITDVSQGYLPDICTLEGLIKLLSVCGHIITSESNVLCVITVDPFDKYEAWYIEQSLRYVHYRHVDRKILAIPGSRLGEKSFIYLPQVCSKFCDLQIRYVDISSDSGTYYFNESKKERWCPLIL